MSMAKGRCFFILTVARSGSTSLARILDTAANGCCAVEPSPNLNVESRLAMDGRLADTGDVVRRLVVPRVVKALAQHEVYGEKNLTYGPFIGDLHEQLGCRFVLIKRDGREVVRSLMDWHDRMFGSVYRECRDPGRLAPRARQAAAGLLLHLDTSDYARPRPRPGAGLYDEWDDLSREEMCAWYWATVNDLYADALGALPADAWTGIDYTRPTADDVLRVAEFCGLEGLDRAAVESMLAQRINSLADRCGNGEARYPKYGAWGPQLRRRFDEIAGAAMARLGYGGGAP